MIMYVIKKYRGHGCKLQKAFTTAIYILVYSPSM